MTKNYISEYDKINNVYNVIETQTSQIIKKFAGGDRQNQKRFINKLNGGNGFNGITPSFFLKEAKITFKI